MKRQIRRNVFETNSSSMHSLVITKDDRIISQEEAKNGLFICGNGDWDIWTDDKLHFGRSPFQCLSTFESKVRYAIASLCGYRDNPKEKFDEIKQIVLDIIPECKGIKLPTEYGKDEIYYGGVDEDILSKFLEKNNISLREFLLNSKYKVIVDGDEYCIYDGLKQSGLINKENIISEYPERN